MWSMLVTGVEHPLVYVPLFALYLLFGIFGALVFYGWFGLAVSTSWLYPLLYKKLKHMDKVAAQSQGGWWYPGAESEAKNKP